MNHKIRWRIVELLQETEKLAYTELLEELNISKGSLNHHLTRLMEAGIIDNYAEGEFRGLYSSYYKLSAFGTDFAKGLLSSVEVTIPIQTTKSDHTRTGLILEDFDNKSSEHVYITSLLQELLSTKHESEKRNILNPQDIAKKGYFSSIMFRKMEKQQKKLPRCI